MILSSIFFSCLLTMFPSSSFRARSHIPPSLKGQETMQKGRTLNAAGKETDPLDPGIKPHAHACTHTHAHTRTHTCQVCCTTQGSRHPHKRPGRGQPWGQLYFPHVNRHRHYSIAYLNKKQRAQGRTLRPGLLRIEWLGAAEESGQVQ